MRREQSSGTRLHADPFEMNCAIVIKSHNYSPSYPDDSSYVYHLKLLLYLLLSLFLFFFSNTRFFMRRSYRKMEWTDKTDERYLKLITLHSVSRRQREILR